jgi:hypothetical protein
LETAAAAGRKVETSQGVDVDSGYSYFPEFFSYPFFGTRLFKLHRIAIAKLPRRTAFNFLEDSVEMGDIVIADVQRDFNDRQVGAAKQLLRRLDSDNIEILREGHVEFLLKYSRDMSGRGYSGFPGDFHQGQIAFMIMEIKILFQPFGFDIDCIGREPEGNLVVRYGWEYRPMTCVFLGALLKEKDKCLPKQFRGKVFIDFDHSPV